MLAHWVHDLSPFLIQFTESFGIRYYGLAYLFGFAAAVWLIRRYHRAGRSALDTNAALDLLMYLVVGVLVGGRLGYFLLYTPGALFSNPMSLFAVWDGGMASHGGMAGVVVAIWMFSRSRRVPFFHVSDLVVTAAPVGLLLGRVANFINGELWGKQSGVPWAVIFENTGGGPDPRHPSQLYQAGLEGAVLLALMQWRFWKTDAARAQPGRIAGEFLVAYAVLRAVGELFREPDAGLILGLSRGTFFSLFLAGAGIAIIAFARKSDPASKRKA